MEERLAVEYANSELSGFLPETVAREGRLIRLRPPPGLPEIADARNALLGAVLHSATPDTTPPLEELVTTQYRGGTVSIILDDHTRANHHTRLLLPHLIEYLRSRGIDKTRLRLIIATGTHRPSSEKELAMILGPGCQPYRDCVVMHSDSAGLAQVGTLDDGAIVEINKTAFHSEILIALSDLEYHYFAGIAGGPKQICPGISGGGIIRKEHLKMFGILGFADNVCSGCVNGNPVFDYKKKVVRTVMAKMRSQMSWIYGIAAVMDNRQKLVHLEGGDIISTHERAQEALAKAYVATVDQPADIVIMSARQTGINLYQSGKAYNAAKKAVKRGGKVLLLSECRDGFGNDEFFTLMNVSAPIFGELAKKLPDALEQDMRAGVRTGPGMAKKVSCGYIDRAIVETQKAVMADFRIGKQKAVDLLDILRYCGWGNLYIIEDGLSDSEKAAVPLRCVGKPEQSADVRLRNWILEQENEKPTYCIIDDPNYLVRVGDDSAHK